MLGTNHGTQQLSRQDWPIQALIACMLPFVAQCAVDAQIQQVAQACRLLSIGQATASRDCLLTPAHQASPAHSCGKQAAAVVAGLLSWCKPSHCCWPCHDPPSPLRGRVLGPLQHVFCLPDAYVRATTTNKANICFTDSIPRNTGLAVNLREPVLMA